MQESEHFEHSKHFTVCNGPHTLEVLRLNIFTFFFLLSLLRFTARIKRVNAQFFSRAPAQTNKAAHAFRCQTPLLDCEMKLFSP